MPEIISAGYLSEEARKKLKGQKLNSITVAQVLRSDASFIGEGGRNVVAAVEGASDKVLAISRTKEMSPEQAKRVFYNQRLFEALFPEHFPHMSAASGKKEGIPSLSFTIRERIVGDHPTKTAIKEAFENFDSVMSELDIPIKLDMARRNFIKDLSGIKYVDTIDFGSWTERHASAVKEWMKRHNIPDDRKTVILSALKRLIMLSIPRSS